MRPNGPLDTEGRLRDVLVGCPFDEQPKYHSLIFTKPGKMLQLHLSASVTWIHARNSLSDFKAPRSMPGHAPGRTTD
jgi:hypothetical protein